jgi:hypothetical protein
MQHGTRPLALLALLSLQCAPAAPAQVAEEDPRFRRLPSAEGAVQRGEAVDLADCRDVATLADMRALIASDALDSMPLAADEGFHLARTRDRNLRISWAVGYGQADVEAPAPHAYPWVSCRLPESFTRDIPSISFGGSAIWKPLRVQITLMDEGDDPRDGRPRREFLVAIDMQTRRVLPRALCYASDDITANPTGHDGCFAQRSCEIGATSGLVRLGEWQTESQDACSDAFEHDRADANRRGVFTF